MQDIIYTCIIDIHGYKYASLVHWIRTCMSSLVHKLRNIRYDFTYIAS